MTNRATANLPSRDFDTTETFYGTLGYIRRWRDDGWMILDWDEVTLEFFNHPDLDPSNSWFSACLRLDDLDAFYATCRDAGIAEKSVGWPRLHAPRVEPWGGRVGALIDPDGTLLRLIQN